VDCLLNKTCDVQKHLFEAGQSPISYCSFDHLISVALDILVDVSDNKPDLDCGDLRDGQHTKFANRRSSKSFSW
jgi:hypothetical protein